MASSSTTHSTRLIFTARAASPRPRTRSRGAAWVCPGNRGRSRRPWTWDTHQSRLRYETPFANSCGLKIRSRLPERPRKAPPAMLLTPGGKLLTWAGPVLEYPSNTAEAHELLCAARDVETGGISLFRLRDPKALSISLMPSTFGALYHEVTLRDVPVTGDNIVGAPGNGWSAIREVLEWGAAAQCAEMVGLAQSKQA